MNLIHSLMNVITGHTDQVLLEIRTRAGGIHLSSVSRIERVNFSEIVIHYQNGRLIGRARIKSTRQTLDHYQEVIKKVYPRIVICEGHEEAARADIELDS